MKGEKMKLGQKFGLPDSGDSVMISPMLKKSHIMLPVAVTAVMLAHAAAASASARADAPAAAHDDAEASSAAELMPGIFPTARTLRIELSLDDSVAGGGAELRLGKASGGRMSLAGTTTSIGFEDGAWYICGDRHRRCFTATNSATAAAGPRTLAVRMRLDADGAPVGVALAADGLPLTFDGLGGDALKAWLDPRRWEDFRVLSRGGADGVSATVTVHADGTLFILR